MFSKIRENLRIATTTLRAGKVRSGLTMLGIVIGVASVVLLLSIGQAFESFIVSEFTSFGSNLVMVWGEVSNTMTIESDANPSDADADELVTFFEDLSWNDYVALSDRFRVPDASIVSPVANMATEAKWQNNETSIVTYGVTETYMEAISLELAAGRFLTADEIANSERGVVFNKRAVLDLFGDDVNPIGQLIKLNGLSFEVVGVLDLGSFEGADGPEIYIPITTMYQRLNSSRLSDGSLPLGIIMLQATDAQASDELIRQVRSTLREVRDLDIDEDDDFQIFAQTEFLETLSTITGLITVFLAVIAGISLVVGGIGIMNIMLVTVTERTREIGLRKAVGAQNSDILMQFITESIMLAVLGGSLGTFFAFALSAMMSSAVPELNIIIQPSSVILATAVSIMIGVFFGAFPANRAAQMNPIDALRFE